MTLARRALMSIAILAAVLGPSAAVVLHHQSEEHEHTMKCLAAYMAFIQVVGGPAEESVERLKRCEQSPLGDEPIHLSPSERSLRSVVGPATLAPAGLRIRREEPPRQPANAEHKPNQQQQEHVAEHCREQPLHSCILTRFGKSDETSPKSLRREPPLSGAAKIRLRGHRFLLERLRRERQD
jgi:hypothetical protein